MTVYISKYETENKEKDTIVKLSGFFRWPGASDFSETHIMGITDYDIFNGVFILHKIVVFARK